MRCWSCHQMIDLIRHRSGRESKMKRRMCQGLTGIIVFTMVTIVIVCYQSRDRSSSSASSLPSHVFNTHGLTSEKPLIPYTSKSSLKGYTSVMDQESLRMHCSTCALVVSSGQLTGGHRGEEIDRSECVIRMNDAPSKNYHADVGQRTSLRVIAHSSLQRVLKSKQELFNSSLETVFIFWGPSSFMRRDGKGHVYNKLKLLKQLLPKLKMFTISRSYMLKFDEVFKMETGIDRRISHTWLSTGWFTMAISLELCDRINVYGMVPPDFCRSSTHTSVPYHYYEPMGPDECSMYFSHESSRKGSNHRFITEKMVFANWAQTHNVHFYQPNWRPTALISRINCSYTPAPAGS